MDNWFQSLKKYSNFSAVLVGTKSDLTKTRAIDDAAVEAFATAHGSMKSFVVSAKTGDGMSALLDTICGLLLSSGKSKKKKGKKKCIVC